MWNYIEYTEILEVHLTEDISTRESSSKVTPLILDLEEKNQLLETVLQGCEMRYRIFRNFEVHLTRYV